MGTSLQFDADGVYSAATSIDSTANGIPMTVAIDMGASGSGDVAAAAESFNMWARLTAEIIQDRLRTTAADARTGMKIMDDTDKAIAFQAMEK